MPPVATPNAAGKTVYSRAVAASRDDARAARAGTARAQGGRPRSAGTAAATRGTTRVVTPPSTQSSSIGTARRTSGTAGTLLCTTGKSGAEDRPLNGKRDRRGGLREPTYENQNLSVERPSTR